MERFDGKYISVVTETGYACIGRMELVESCLTSPALFSIVDPAVEQLVIENAGSANGILKVREDDLELSLSQYRIRSAPLICGIEIRDDHLVFLDEEGEIVINNEISYMGVAACYEICWSRSSLRPWLSGFFP